ncbi:MAG: DUF4386 domain-containing protein [Chitinophagaceae bacterium]|nr:DUF4386 domain-containing protein [Chitinophagaceae bacterium]
MDAPQNSPKVYARTAGALYLVLIVVGLFAEVFVRNRLVVPGNSNATADHILASPGLWRAGIVADLIMHVLDIPIMWLVYILFRPVNRNLALLVLLFNLVQTAVLVANKLNLVAALLPLENSDYQAVFGAQQLHSQVYLSLKLHDYGFGIGLIFFGFVCLIEGYLILRSGLLPGFIGTMMQLAGICYLISSFTQLLAPRLESPLFLLLMLPCIVGELSFCLWLLIKGVHTEKWKQLVSESRQQ